MSEQAGIFNAVTGTLNSTATLYGEWKLASRDDRFGCFYKATGASAQFDIYLDVSPFGETLTTASTTASYIAKLMGSSLSASAALTELDAILSNSPFAQVRIRVVGGASNGTDTAVYVYGTKSGL